MMYIALQKNTVTGLQHHRRKYGNLMEDSVEKKTQIIVICFGVMVFVNIAIKKIIYTR